MEKMTAAVMAILLIFGLTACGTVQREELVGVYDLVSFTTSSGKSLSEEEIEEAKARGGSATLEVRDDNTATLDIFGSRTEWTYDVNRRIFTYNGNNARFTYSDGKLTMTDNSSTIVFRKR